MINKAASVAKSTRAIKTTRTIKTKMVTWANKLKKYVLAVWIAARDPRTKPVPKVIALSTAAYALSPIDLIPDFIPVIGFIDDLILVPLGIALVIRMIPKQLMAEYISKANNIEIRPVSFLAAIAIILVWAVITYALVSAFLPR